MLPRCPEYIAFHNLQTCLHSITSSLQPPYDSSSNRCMACVIGMVPYYYLCLHIGKGRSKHWQGPFQDQPLPMKQDHEGEEGPASGNPLPVQYQPVDKATGHAGILRWLSLPENEPKAGPGWAWSASGQQASPAQPRKHHCFRPRTVFLTVLVSSKEVREGLLKAGLLLLVFTCLFCYIKNRGWTQLCTNRYATE